MGQGKNHSVRAVSEDHGKSQGVYPVFVTVLKALFPNYSLAIETDSSVETAPPPDAVALFVTVPEFISASEMM